MIKNYCIKIISSVFIMLTIFMVSTSVFAATVTVRNVSDTENSRFLRENVEAQYVKLNGPYASEISNYQMFSSVSGYANIFTFVTGLNGYKVGYLQISNLGAGDFYKLADTNGTIMDSANYRAVSLTYSSSNGAWSISAHTSSGNYSNLPYSTVLYSNTDLSVIDTNGSVIYEGDYTVGLTEKKIIYQVDYSEDNKTAVLSAEIKNCAEGDKLYYSLLGFRFNGKLMNPIELNQSQATVITLNRNTMIHLQALDSGR